jgi:hypothetical protein
LIDSFFFFIENGTRNTKLIAIARARRRMSFGQLFEKARSTSTGTVPGIGLSD